MVTAQFVGLTETDRVRIAFTVDGRTAEALEGDIVLTALLVEGREVRQSEFGDGPRAGHCVMGACQDCWVWLAGGERIRACSTFVKPGLSVLTHNPERPWTNHA